MSPVHRISLGLVLGIYIVLGGKSYAQCPAKTTFGSLLITNNWQAISYGRGGEGQLFYADSGCVYQFSFCLTDGGYAPFDTEITIFNNSPLQFAGGYNDDAPGCGLSSKVTWEAPANGTYRVQTDKKPCANDTRLVTLAYRRVSCPPPPCANVATPICIYDAAGGLGNCNFVGDLCSDGFAFDGTQKNSNPIQMPELQVLDSIRFYLYTTGCPPNPVQGFTFFLNNQIIGTASPGSFDCLCAAVDYPRIILVTGPQLQGTWNFCGNNVLGVSANNDPGYAISGYRAILFHSNKPPGVPLISSNSQLCGTTILSTSTAPCHQAYYWQDTVCDTLRNFPATQNYTAIHAGIFRLRTSSISLQNCWSDTCSAFEVFAPITGNTLISDQTVCAGALPAVLSGSALSGGSGNYAYQWESSPDSVSWNPILDATQFSYQPLVPTQQVWYRRWVLAGCNHLSTPVHLFIESPVSGNSITGNQTLCETNTPLSLSGTTPVGGTEPFTWLWLVSQDSVNWTLIPGATTSVYSPLAQSHVLGYRRLVDAGVCPPDTSPAVFIYPERIIGLNQLSSDQSICSGSIPNILSGTQPSGGNQQYLFQWEISPDVLSWQLIPGATFPDYLPPALTQSNYYRRIVEAGLCPDDTSAFVHIIVEVPLGQNIISSDQTLCEGISGNPLSGSVPTGGSGIYQYQWESSGDNNTWQNITDATSTNYNLVASPGQVYYRRIVKSGACPDLASNSVLISAQPAIVNNNLGSSQTLCSTGSPGQLSGVIPLSGGTGIFQYQWEHSSDALTWQPISGATLVNYSAPVLVNSIYYRRIVVSGICTDTSASQYWQVIPVITNNIIGNEQTLCTGELPSVLSGPVPAGTGPNHSYQWEASTNLQTWNPIPGASNLQYQSPTLAQTTYFRRILSSSVCVPLTTQVLQILVFPALGNNTITSSQTLCEYSQVMPLTGTIPTGSNGNIVYHWEESSNGNNWQSVSGGNQQNYAPPALGQSRYYRRILLNSLCQPDTSNTLLIEIERHLNQNTIGNNQTLCLGVMAQTFTGSLPTGGNGNYIYEWQSSLNQQVWLPAGNQQNHTPVNIAQAVFFRRLVSAGVCPGLTSLTVEILVQNPITGNTIFGNQTICESETPALLTGNLPSGGNQVFHYQWESSIDNVNWLQLPNTFQINYQPAQVLQSVYYRRWVSSGLCPDHSSASVWVRSDRVIGNNTIIGDQTICLGAPAAGITGSLPSGGIFTFQYLWQSSFDMNAWANATGIITQQNYIPGAPAQSLYLRRIITSGVCAPHTSSPVFIQVLSFPSDNVISGSQTLCDTESISLLSGTIPQGGDGAWLYDWQQSNDAINWSEADGVFNQRNYQPPAFTGVTYFRRRVENTYCPMLISNTLRVHIDEAISGNIISGNQTLCAGEVPALLNGELPGGSLDGTFIFWQFSTDLLSWTQADTNLQYQPPALWVQHYFRRIVKPPVCTADTSLIVHVDVQRPIVDNTISPSQTLCEGMPVSPLSGSIPGGGTGQYQYTWQSGTDSLVWITCGNSRDFAPGLVTQNIFLRRMVTSGFCDPSTSNLISIIIQPRILYNSIGSEQTICGGQSPASLSGTEPSGGAGQYAFMWQSSSGNGIWQNIPGAFYQDYNPPVLYTSTLYRRIVSGGACFAITSQAVLIQVKPQPNVWVNQDTICAGERLTLYAQTDMPGGSYFWSPGGETTAFIEVSPNVSTAYSVQYEYQSCLAQLVTAFITVVPLPPAVITWQGSEILCVGDSKVLTVNAGGGNYTYLWNTGQITQTLLATGPGVYSVTVRDGNACAQTVSVELRYANPPLFVSAPAVSSVCSGFQQQINAIPSGGVPPYEVIWSPASGLSNPNILSPLVTIQGPQTYTVNIRDQADCTAQASVSVGLSLPVKADFYIEKTSGDTLYFPDSVRIVNTSLNAIDCRWILDSDQFSHVCNPKPYQVREEGRYTLSLWVVSPEGCRDSITRSFWYSTLPTVSYPTAFSPNGDGINDYFFIPGLNILSIRVYIFDRWGNNVFYSENPAFTWDGNLNGNPLMEGIYILRVTGEGMHGEPFEYNGTLTLLR